MKGFNLLPTDAKSKNTSSSIIRVSGSSTAIFLFLFLIIFFSIGIFVADLYYNIQINDKGKNMISLIKRQDTYSQIINDLNKYSARSQSVTSIKQSKVRFEDIVKDLDLLTNKTIYLYRFDKIINKYFIQGVVNDPILVMDITEKFRKSSKYTNIVLERVDAIQSNKQSTNMNKNYTYNISFVLNNEKD